MEPLQGSPGKEAPEATVSSAPCTLWGPPTRAAAALELSRALVGEDHVVGVTQLLQARVSGCLDQGWRATHQDEGGLPRSGEVLLDHVGADEA